MALTTSTVQPPHSVVGILEKKHMKTGDDFLRMTKLCVLTIASNQHVLTKIPTPKLLDVFVFFWWDSQDLGVFFRVIVVYFARISILL